MKPKSLRLIHWNDIEKDYPESQRSDTPWIFSDQPKKNIEALTRQEMTALWPFIPWDNQNFIKDWNLDTARQTVVRQSFEFYTFFNSYVGSEGLVFDQSRLMVHPVHFLAVGRISYLQKNISIEDFKMTFSEGDGLDNLRWKSSWPVNSGEVLGHYRYHWRQDRTDDETPESYMELLNLVQPICAPYFHILTVTLPRLIASEALIKEHPDMKILVDVDFGGSFENQYFWQYIDLLGISRSRFIVYDPRRIYFAVKLVQPTPTRLWSIPPEMLAHTNSRLNLSATEVKNNRVLVINRKSDEKRSLLNIGELIEYLERHSGCELVQADLTELSVVEQMALFRSVDTVVAVHGAALANMIFLPPSAKVIEIMPSKLHNRSITPSFWFLAHLLGHRHCPVILSDFSWSDSVRVTNEDCDRILKAIVS